MHQAGGSADRKKAASRCAVVRQRGAILLAADINFWRSAKTSHSRAVPSLEAVTTRLPSGLNAAPTTLSPCPMPALPLPPPTSPPHPPPARLVRPVRARGDELAAGNALPQPRGGVAGCGHDTLAVGAERRA